VDALVDHVITIGDELTTPASEPGHAQTAG